MTAEIYQNMMTAVETGKWQDGTPLSQQQLDNAIQATIAYASLHKLNQGELFSIDQEGELIEGKKLKKMSKKSQKNNQISVKTINK